MDKIKLISETKKYFCHPLTGWYKPRADDDEKQRDYALTERTHQKFDKMEDNIYDSNIDLILYKRNGKIDIAFSSIDAEHFISLPNQLIKKVVKVFQDEKVIKKS